jgi:hypothetical protein
MARDIPRFGNYQDPDVERALQWFLGFMTIDDWNRRVVNIEDQLELVITPRSSLEELTAHGVLSIRDDRMGWYLYLVDTALHDAIKYEPTQGSRVLPVFKMLGANLDLLKEIRGVESRVSGMLAGGRSQPDSALFELLIGLLWKRNGSTQVEFIEEQPTQKRPDIRAVKNDQEWFIECKRLQKSSEYSEEERTKWLTMWAPLRNFLIDRRLPAVLDMTFHVELTSLPESFLLEQLEGKLPLVQLPCVLIDNETWSVSAKPVNYAAAREHLRRYHVRYPSDQLNELIAGHRDAHRGFTGIVGGKYVRFADRGSSSYLTEMEFAAGSFWSCDAPDAIARKARDIRRHLANAVDQLPDDAKGAVHVALETLDGPDVELERLTRIMRSVAHFDSRGKDLRWVYCHTLRSYAPPDEMWVMDETVHHFGKNQPGNAEPLGFRTAIIPEHVEGQDGVHWLREPP